MCSGIAHEYGVPEYLISSSGKINPSIHAQIILQGCPSTRKKLSIVLVLLCLVKIFLEKLLDFLF